MRPSFHIQAQRLRRDLTLFQLRTRRASSRGGGLASSRRRSCRVITKGFTSLGECLIVLVFFPLSTLYIRSVRVGPWDPTVRHRARPIASLFLSFQWPYYPSLHCGRDLLSFLLAPFQGCRPQLSLDQLRRSGRWSSYVMPLPCRHTNCKLCLKVTRRGSPSVSSGFSYRSPESGLPQRKEGI